MTQNEPDHIPDAKRHINLATITPGSKWFNASHAQIDCPVHQPKGPTT